MAVYRGHPAPIRCILPFVGKLFVTVCAFPSAESILLSINDHLGNFRRGTEAKSCWRSDDLTSVKYRNHHYPFTNGGIFSQPTVKNMSQQCWFNFSPKIAKVLNVHHQYWKSTHLKHVAGEKYILQGTFGQFLWIVVVVGGSLFLYFSFNWILKLDLSISCSLFSSISLN